MKKFYLVMAIALVAGMTSCGSNAENNEEGNDAAFNYDENQGGEEATINYNEEGEEEGMTDDDIINAVVGAELGL